MNLGWKLGHACKHDSSENEQDRKYKQSVLASYETERKANAINYIQTAVRLGELINQMGQETQPEQPIKMKSIRSKLGDGLGDESNPMRGTLFPQCIMESGEKLDDVVGYSAFTVRKNKAITLDTSADDFLKTLKNSEGNSVIYADQEPSLAAILTKLDAEEVVVRADRYILSSKLNICC
jgi:3-(3-hydroxy-phenyl)propionate hydroxylase